jgi:hypothetical protein
MIAKLVRQFGNVSVVEDSLDSKLKLIPSLYAEGVALGEDFQVTSDVLMRGIEYAIDWSILFPDGIHIKSETLQKSFYAQGIFTLEDVNMNPNLVVSAINSVLKLTAVEIVRKSKEILGGE